MLDDKQHVLGYAVGEPAKKIAPAAPAKTPARQTAKPRGHLIDCTAGRLVVSQLAARGLTFKAWCDSHGFNARTASFVLMGALGKRQAGVTGQIVKALKDEFGVIVQDY